MWKNAINIMKTLEYFECKPNVTYSTKNVNCNTCNKLYNWKILNSKAYYFDANVKFIPVSENSFRLECDSYLNESVLTCILYESDWTEPKQGVTNGSWVDITYIGDIGVLSLKQANNFTEQIAGYTGNSDDYFLMPYIIDMENATSDINNIDLTANISVHGYVTVNKKCKKRVSERVPISSIGSDLFKGQISGNTIRFKYDEGLLGRRFETKNEPRFTPMYICSDAFKKSNATNFDFLKAKELTINGRINPFEIFQDPYTPYVPLEVFTFCEGFIAIIIDRQEGYVQDVVLKYDSSVKIPTEYMYSLGISLVEAGNSSEKDIIYEELTDLDRVSSNLNIGVLYIKKNRR